MTPQLQPRTLFAKIWDDHVVAAEEGQQTILYIDRHLVHEVTSAQAFEGLRLAGRKVRRTELAVATVDHNIPTTDRRLPIADPISKQQIDTLRENCRQFGITLYDFDDPHQGIVHIIGPELGMTQPGMTIVCGDSHTATHGAFGALAFGIGTSEVEHVLATQTLLQSRPKTMELRVGGTWQDNPPNAKLIGRRWYDITAWNLTPDGRCKQCGERCAGIFDGSPGDWGTRRMPISIQAI